MNVMAAARCHEVRREEMMTAARTCAHLQTLSTVLRPTRLQCGECITIGSEWVHLRTCQTCGETLCCDSSPNRHARKHAETLKHPVIASAEPAESWVYCFLDDALAKY